MDRRMALKGIVAAALAPVIPGFRGIPLLAEPLVGGTAYEPLVWEALMPAVVTPEGVGWLEDLSMAVNGQWGNYFLARYSWKSNVDRWETRNGVPVGIVESFTVRVELDERRREGGWYVKDFEDGVKMSVRNFGQYPEINFPLLLSKYNFQPVPVRGDSCGIE